MTGLGVTLIVSGLKAKAPGTWSSVTDQAISPKRPRIAMTQLNKLGQITKESISQASWVSLGIGPDNTLSGAARLDVVLWMAGGELPADDVIGRSIDQVTRQVDTVRLVNENWSRELPMERIDPWTSELTQGWHRWPGGWHTIERNDRFAITCTRRALPAVRMWFVASTARYLDGHRGNSLSGLLETADELRTRGAFAEYVGYLAVERRHRITGMLTSVVADNTDDPVKHALEVARLREVEANINVTAVNISAAASRLAASLGPRDAEGWTFLKADDLDMAKSLATARGNAERAASVQDRLRITQQHQDAEAQRTETRANSYATLLLTVAAGAFTGAALIAKHRTAASIAFAGTLFVIGLLLVDAARPYLRIHLLLATAVMAGAGAAGAIAADRSALIGVAGAAIGAAVGLGVFCGAWALQILQRRRPQIFAWLIGRFRHPGQIEHRGKPESSG